MELKTLETERLYLRKFKKIDATDMFRNWLSDEEVCKYVSWKPYKSLDEAYAFTELKQVRYRLGDYYDYAIVYKKNDEVIGEITLTKLDLYNKKCELGFNLGRKYWNMGIMTEAVERILEFAFNELNLKEIRAAHHLKNKASGKVMRKVGMEFEEIVMNKYKDKNDEFIPCTVYLITKEMYKKRTI